MNSNYRNFALWGLIALLLIALFQMFQSPGGNVQSREIAYSEFKQAVDRGEIGEVKIAGDRITGTYTDGTRGFSTYAPNDPDLISNLEAKDVTIAAAPQADGRNSFFGMLINWLPLLLLVGRVDLHHAPDAGRPGQGDGLRQIQGRSC